LHYKKNKFETIREKLSEYSDLKIIKKDPEKNQILTGKILESFSLLGYDLNSEYIYAVTDKCTNWQWYTTKNKTYPKNFWNKNDKRYEQKYTPYFLSDHILKHCFPLELKNKSKYNDSNYIHIDMCGSSFKENSDILVIDIDNHKNEGSLSIFNEFQIIKNHFENKIVYMEISKDFGLHIFVKLDKVYSLNEKQEYFKSISKEYNLTHSHLPFKMRFPLSYHYQPCDLDLNHNNPIDTIEKIKTDYKNLSGFNINPVARNLLTEKLITNEKVYKPSALYKRQGKKINHITPDEFLQTTDIIISKNNRHLPMLEICRISKFNNWNTDQTLNVIRNLDHGSNDLKKWDNTRLSKEIEHIKNKSKIYYSETATNYCKPDTFISNEKYVPLEIKNLIQSDEFIINTIQNSNYKLTELNIKKFKAVSIELFGYIYYNTHNSKQTTRDKKYLVGIQFSPYYCELFKKYLQESKQFISIDVYDIIHTIMQYSNFFNQYFINDRGWFYLKDNIENNYCRQYDLSNNKHHYLFNNSNIISYLLINKFQELFRNKIKVKLLYIQTFINDIINKVKEYFIVDNEYGLIHPLIS